MPGHRQFWISKPDACAMLRLGPAQLDKAWRPLLPASAERKNGRSIEIDAAELHAVVLREKLAAAAVDAEIDPQAASLEKLRAVKTRIAEAELSRLTQDLVPIDQVDEQFRLFGDAMQSVCRRLAWDNHPDAYEIVVEAMRRVQGLGDAAFRFHKALEEGRPRFLVPGMTMAVIIDDASGFWGEFDGCLTEAVQYALEHHPEAVEPMQRLLAAVHDHCAKRFARPDVEETYEEKAAWRRSIEIHIRGLNAPKTVPAWRTTLNPDGSHSPIRDASADAGVAEGSAPVGAGFRGRQNRRATAPDPEEDA